MPTSAGIIAVRSLIVLLSCNTLEITDVDTSAPFSCPRPRALLHPAHAQDGKIAIEKFNHSEWTKGIFSEAVTVTGIGNAKFIYLAGVGAEDENGARGNIRHPGNFIEQCKYAYDKIKRVLAHHGASSPTW